MVWRWCVAHFAAILLIQYNCQAFTTQSQEPGGVTARCHDLWCLLFSGVDRKKTTTSQPRFWKKLKISQVTEWPESITEMIFEKSFKTQPNLTVFHVQCSSGDRPFLVCVCVRVRLSPLFTTPCRGGRVIFIFLFWRYKNSPCKHSVLLQRSGQRNRCTWMTQQRPDRWWQVVNPGHGWHTGATNGVVVCLQQLSVWGSVWSLNRS